MCVLVPRGPTPTACAFVGAFAPGSLRSRRPIVFLIGLPLANCALSHRHHGDIVGRRCVADELVQRAEKSS